MGCCTLQGVGRPDINGGAYSTISSSTLEVGDVLRDAGEFCVGFLFLFEGLLEQFGRFVVAHDIRPGAETAVGGDLVVFDFLGGGDEGGIEGSGALVFAEDLLAFTQDASHPFAFLPLGLLVEGMENLVEPLNLALGLVGMCGEGFAQLVGLSGLGQLGERLDQLLFGVVRVS